MASGEKLTKRFIDGLQPAEKDYFVWDRDLSGFGVRILTSGRKTYLAQYRVGGRQRRVRLGRHGAVTVDQARRHAQEVIGDVARGGNPADDVARDRRAVTMSALCDRFLNDHVAHRCKGSTSRDYHRAVTCEIKPRLGSFKIPDITRTDIAQLHHDLRHKPYHANRVLAVLSKMFNLAELWGLRPDGSNPCRHVKKYAETKRERFLSSGEILRLGEALTAFETEQPSMKSAVDAIRLLILTGCRLSEVQMLKWSYVHDRYFRLPDSKTGRKDVPIGPAVHEVLASIERQPDNDYVIAGRFSGQHLTDLQRPWRRIRERAGIDDVRIHDLRHTYASHAVISGESLPIIGKLLGHTQVQTTARYAHLDADPVNAAADRVSGNLATALFGRKPPEDEKNATKD